MKLSTGLKPLVQPATNRLQWSQYFVAALGSTRRFRCFRDANASAANPTVTGTEFLNVALTGEMLINADTGVITFLGLMSDATVQLAADLATGSCGFIISGGGHEVKGTLGLTGSGKELMLGANPTTTAGFGFTSSVTLRPPSILPLPTPNDGTVPSVSISANSTNVTTAATLILTATATDNVGVTKVEFFENGVLLATDTNSPYTTSKNLSHTSNGTFMYTAKAFDAAGNNTTSAPVQVVVNITPPVEAPTAVAVGGTFTDIKFQNPTSTTQTNVPITFGQVFTKGSFPGTSAAVDLKAVDNSLVTCQLDVKNLYSDGTVKFALLSAIIPSLPGSSTVTYNIVRRAAPPSGAAAVPADFSGLNAIATLVDTGTDLAGPNAGTTYTADASALLTAGTYTTWLSGPVVSEWHLRVPLKTAGNVEHPDLHARFHIRAYKGQAKARISYGFENCWAKPKVPQPTALGASPWEVVSVQERIYRLSLQAGATTVYTRSTKGRVPLELNTANSIGGTTASGLPNNSTVYTATISVDGTSYPISITGSAAQTMTLLWAALKSQTGNKLECDVNDARTGLLLQSPTTGTNSKVRITNYGTLFPAMKMTGMSGSGTYTAQITINGSIVKEIAIVGNNAQSFGTLCAQLNTQFGGDATATPIVGTPGIRFVSTATGLESDVVITNPGNIFRPTDTTNKYLRVYRPIDGDEIVHYPTTRYRRLFWWNTTEPSVHIIHNKAYMYATKAAPAYDLSVVMNQASIDSDHSTTFAARDFGSVLPAGNAMANTGIVPHIGMLTKWQAVWFLSQNIKAKQTMIESAERAGFYPVYWRDYATDHPLNLDNWPYASITINPGDTRNTATGLNEKLPDPAVTGNTSPYWNIPDTSHHPDFFWFPYLSTGDYFYLEGMLFHQAYTNINANPATTWRNGRKGLVFRDQIRGQAWSLRAMAHCAWAAPDGHPNKASVLYKLEENRLWYVTNMLTPGSLGYSPCGWNYAYTTAYNGGLGVAPWQDDFFTIITGRIVELGFSEYESVHNYKVGNIVGRLTSGADYCWRACAAYSLMVRNTTTGPIFTTWLETFQKNYQTAAGVPCDSSQMSTILATTNGSANGNPADSSSYFAVAKGAAGYATQSSVAATADAWLVITSSVVQPDYTSSPHYCFVPRT